MKNQLKFNKEDELVQAFVKKAHKFLHSIHPHSKKNGFIIQEFDSNYGVADLVLGATNKIAKQQIKRAPINLNWMFPLTELIDKEVFSFIEFEKRFSLQKTSAKKRLKDYQAAGFISFRSDGFYQVASTYKPVTDIIVSIEAKLKNWKRALLQATRYKRFSDYSFVLLDKKHSKTAIEHIQHFEKNNVGLIVMNGKNIELVFMPQLNKKKLAEYQLRLNEVIINQLRHDRAIVF